MNCIRNASTDNAGSWTLNSTSPISRAAAAGAAATGVVAGAEEGAAEAAETEAIAADAAAKIEPPAPATTTGMTGAVSEAIDCRMETGPEEDQKAEER